MITALAGRYSAAFYSEPEIQASMLSLYGGWVSALRFMSLGQLEEASRQVELRHLQVGPQRDVNKHRAGVD